MSSVQQHNAMADDGTGLPWEPMYNISCSWVDVLIFTSFYLESCIWPDVILRWILKQLCIKFCANPGKSVMETVAMIIHVFGEETLSMGV
jgi:hypothetical protein